jgi:hypothetical protein
MTHPVRRIIEGALIVLGLLSFWPWILGYRGMLYQIGLVAVAVALGILASVRMKRIKKALRDYAGNAQQPPPPPGAKT